MKAIRYWGPKDIRLEDIPEPVAGDGQIKIKIAWNGICGSDLHAYFTHLPQYPTLTEPQYVTGETLPVVIGHELSGTIAELGKGVDANKFHVGQHVTVEPILSCNESTCGPCMEGTRNLCNHLTFIGIGGGGGGLAEYFAVKQELVFPLPDNIPLEIGALMEPLSVVWHAVNRSGLRDGNSVLVIGAGPIGLLLLKVLRARGAGWIGVSEPASVRRETAVKFGASATFDPISTNVVAATEAATGGHGADVVFDCAGLQVSIDTAVAAVRTRGTVVNVAVWEGPVSFNLNKLAKKECTLTSTIGCDRVHDELIQAVASGKLTGLEEVITSKIALEDTVERGILALIKEKDTQIKILVHP